MIVRRVVEDEEQKSKATGPINDRVITRPEEIMMLFGIQLARFITRNRLSVPLKSSKSRAKADWKIMVQLWSSNCFPLL
jgi:hypothetical protein